MFNEILVWLEATSVGTAVRESAWMFPTIETIHVLAIALVFGTIAMVDLRLIGFASRGRGVKELSEEVLPWTWVSFAFAVITGGLLFSSAATRYGVMLQFQLKMLMLVMAGINMMIFHFLTYKRVAEWNQEIKTPLAARTAGALSLILWTSVIALGRWIGFM